MDADIHRTLAVETNQLAWKLLESRADDDLLVHVAHASAFHWAQAGGGPQKRQRAEWLIARVYSELGFGVSALRHARRCQEITEGFPDAMADFDRAYALEGLARAYAADRDRDATRRYRLRAREAGAQIAAAEDRRVFEGDFAAGAWHGATDEG